ncbi:UPF0686 protein C11orf1 homolog isoform X2 [Cricetulus griseus]|uniref:UPF0686 protein C11orf1 homolog isoform X2 n=1 Tax=Cricetulus griseus TaxID=10029 RepID=A0A9J7FY58_CRIGR|nr:UPF0686 protein C11orf1 homolog isoform X2 [Cricetulus griseus]
MVISFVWRTGKIRFGDIFNEHGTATKESLFLFEIFRQIILFTNKLRIEITGNWNQERYDLKNIVKPKPLPSQFGHYFESTYDTSYNSKKPQSAHRFKRDAHWFPGHQPELDPPHYKCTEKSTYMSSYSKPQPSHYSWCLYDPNVEQALDPGV